MKKRVENYIVLLSEIIGKGAFGTVYKGYEQHTNEQVAIKCLQKTKTVDLNQYAQEALRLEIKILYQVESEYIVRFKDVIQTANNYYIIQELCDGGDFGKYLQENKRMREAQAIGFMIQILKGFSTLIVKGIVHRDMKPENILLHHGKLKIADFGLSKPVSGTIFLESNVGTPMYQSPQMIAGDKYTYKCDIWALGILYYYMLYHQHPWRTGVNFLSHLQSIQKHKIDFPEDIQVSQESKKFIVVCLQYNQSDRADWHFIYTNPIFQGKLPKVDRLSETFNYIVSKLRKSIHESNLNLKRFFTGQKLYKGCYLKYKWRYQRITQFSRMIHKISDSISSEELEYMFTQFDKDRNGKIEFEEFQICLKEHQIQVGNRIKAAISLRMEDELQKTELFRREKHEEICAKVRKSLQEREIYDLYELFINSDTKDLGYLSFEQIRVFLKEIDPNISSEEAHVLFDKFDESGNKKITFKEFHKNMCLITGTPLYQ